MKSLSESCESQLFNCFEHSPGFLLLDMTANHPLEELLHHCPQERKLHLGHPDFVRAPEKAPLLVSLAGRHDPLLLASIELAVDQCRALECKIRQVSGWFFSNYALGDLGRRLSARLTISHAEGRLRWRIYDPRITAQLYYILKPEQLSLLLQGIDRWCYLDEAAQLQSFEAPALLERPALGAFMLYLIEHQIAALRCAETVNGAISLLRRLGHPYDRNWIETLHNGVMRARRRGWSDPVDQMVFAAHCIQVHPLFDQHPTLEQILSRALTKKRSFLKAMSEVADSTLMALAQELNGAQWVPHQGGIPS
jgi:hypothetical protein